MALGIRRAALAVAVSCLLGGLRGLRVGDKDSLDTKRPASSSVADEEDELAWMNDVDMEDISPDWLHDELKIDKRQEAPRFVQSVRLDSCVTESEQNITDAQGYFKCDSGCEGKRLFWSKNSFITMLQGDRRQFPEQNKDMQRDNPRGLSMHRKVKGDTMFAHVLNLAQDLCEQGGYCLYLDWCDEMNNHHNQNWETKNSPEIVAAGWHGSEQGRQHEVRIHTQLGVSVGGFADVFVDTRENQGKFCAAERAAAEDRFAHCAIVSISFEDVVPGSTGEKGSRGFGIPREYINFPYANVSKFIRGAIHDCQRDCPMMNDKYEYGVASRTGSALSRPAHAPRPRSGMKHSRCGPQPRLCEYSKSR